MRRLSHQCCHHAMFVALGIAVVLILLLVHLSSSRLFVGIQVRSLVVLVVVMVISPGIGRDDMAMALV